MSEKAARAPTRSNSFWWVSWSALAREKESWKTPMSMPMMKKDPRMHSTMKKKTDRAVPKGRLGMREMSPAERSAPNHGW